MPGGPLESAGTAGLEEESLSKEFHAYLVCLTFILKRQPKTRMVVQPADPATREVEVGTSQVQDLYP